MKIANIATPALAIALCAGAALLGAPAAHAGETAATLHATANSYRGGPSYAVLEAGDAGACAAVCEADAQCQAFNYVAPQWAGGEIGLCELKAEALAATASDCCVAGARAPVMIASRAPEPRMEPITEPEREPQIEPVIDPVISAAAPETTPDPISAPEPELEPDPAAPVLAAAQILVIDAPQPTAHYKIASSPTPYLEPRSDMAPRYSVQKEHSDPTPGAGPANLLGR